ncbi:hypothetical protein [Roseimaritima ulvae]|uniref:hypothetical protein n=1 Tax=Roseimaritima ulvae TaxID=980254 RepID=UPI0012F9AA56|nr:hypothetical protein [Roseimaritima ulvae]
MTTIVLTIVICVVIKAVTVVVSVPVNAAMVELVIVVILSSDRLSEIDGKKKGYGGYGNGLGRHVFQTLCKCFIEIVKPPALPAALLKASSHEPCETNLTRCFKIWRLLGGSRLVVVSANT